MVGAGGPPPCHLLAALLAPRRRRYLGGAARLLRPLGGTDALADAVTLEFREGADDRQEQPKTTDGETEGFDTPDVEFVFEPLVGLTKMSALVLPSLSANAGAMLPGAHARYHNQSTMFASRAARSACRRGHGLASLSENFVPSSDTVHEASAQCTSSARS